MAGGAFGDAFGFAALGLVGDAALGFGGALGNPPNCFGVITGFATSVASFFGVGATTSCSSSSSYTNSIVYLGFTITLAASTSFYT